MNVCSKEMLYADSRKNDLLQHQALYVTDECIFKICPNSVKNTQQNILYCTGFPMLIFTRTVSNNIYLAGLEKQQSTQSHVLENHFVQFSRYYLCLSYCRNLFWQISNKPQNMKSISLPYLPCPAALLATTYQCERHLYIKTIW